MKSILSAVVGATLALSAIEADAQATPGERQPSAYFMHSCKLRNQSVGNFGRRTVCTRLTGSVNETMRILDDVIILFVHANPDGNDLTAEWYMRNPVPEQRGTGSRRAMR